MEAYMHRQTNGYTEKLKRHENTDAQTDKWIYRVVKQTCENTDGQADK